MKNILIFANESQFSKELIQFFISRRFNVHIFSIKPFKDKAIFVNALPLQLTISVMNVANHYNWKHEMPKHDIVINTLKFSDFHSHAQNSVFANFTHQFAETTLNLGKKVIYLSNILNESTHNQTVNDVETAMLKFNPQIFYAKYAFLIDANSRLLLSMMNTNAILSSTRILKSLIAITNSGDIQAFIMNVIDDNVKLHEVYLSGESFTIRDIIDVIEQYIGKKNVIIIPHFALRFISKMLSFLPQTFYGRYLNHSYIIKRLERDWKYPKHNRYTKYTLFASIVERQSCNIFNPKID